MKKHMYVVLFVALMCLGIGTVDAQVYHASQAPNQGYGIQATGQPGNGAARHRYNGYVGVNSRHYSHYPMRYGTNATGVRYHGGYGQSVHYGAGRMPYRGYATPCPPYGAVGYGYGYTGSGRVHVGGGYQGNGWYIQGGVVIR